MGASYCAREKKPCLFWAERYFRDCLCNLSDEISFALGLISLVCWGVAEIPQIVTNFFSKSGHGVSLAFLLTWVVGDVFNLVGCLLEPATLPTQYYTALLYTTTTVVLVLQTLYYDYVRRWRKSSEMNLENQVAEDDETEPLKFRDSSTPTSASPLMITPSRDKYYMSARSLASSGTPTYGSYLGRQRSGPQAAFVAEDDDEDASGEERFSSPRWPASQPIAIPRSVGYGTFLSATLSKLPYQSKALVERSYSELSGRELLQEKHSKSSVYGIWLGWLMAAIYMGGRLPQIWLNIKRGSVEGLNPLMFIFALVANVTYVGSILVRSTEWEKIKANMPWLLDAVVCVALDLFIILQFIYYRFFKSNIKRHGESYAKARPAPKA